MLFEAHLPLRWREFTIIASDLGDIYSSAEFDVVNVELVTIHTPINFLGEGLATLHEQEGNCENYGNNE